MRLSHYFLPLVKETPSSAVLSSHQLMLRAGMIRKLSSGLYTWLPLGLRTLMKVERIVREEMNRIQALELLMPIVQPAELWEETERWSAFGPELFKMHDRHARQFCLGPTHEEVITALLRNEIRSYKQLPIVFYQIQTKFRDEIRPRFGVMRGREFLMKDAYSFHIDQASLKDTYEAMYGAYEAIFKRLGLNFKAVLADPGLIGGKVSHEFHALADAGEDQIVYSEGGYAANIEMAQAKIPEGDLPEPVGSSMEIIDTPGLYTIDALCESLNIPIEKTLKTIIVEGSKDKLVALMLRGDHTLNPLKAEKLPQVASPLTLASSELIHSTLGCHIGSIGPVNLPLPIIVDHDALYVSDFYCGANTDDQHYAYVNWGRDLPVPAERASLRFVESGDKSPQGEGTLQITRGIELGHIFQLGEKYSKAMGATVLDEKGRAVHLVMGCYGIGISRIVAAAIEQHHDEKGIIWPLSMAPFEVILIPMNQFKSYRVREKVNWLYQACIDAGIEVLLDDRKERAGVQFASADLIGIPHRVVISEKSLDADCVEYKHRCEKTLQSIPCAKIVDFLCRLVMMR